VLKRIFELKEDRAGVWRRLSDEELHNMYTSPNVIRAFKSRRMRMKGHVARVERCKMHKKLCMV
jgi:hypothetical protein